MNEENAKAKADGVIWDRAELLHSELNLLDKALSEMNERFSPVMAEPSPTEEVAMEESGGNSMVGASLTDAVLRTRRIRLHINEMIGRCDL